jgi:hypothetical protein
MTWKYHGKLIYPNAGERVVSGSTIGRELSPEHQEIIDRVRAESMRRLEERRKRRDE